MSAKANSRKAIAKQTHVGCLIVTLVAGTQACKVQAEVESWIHCNGVEWTVRRMKALWNAALHLRNGDPDAAKAVYQENSISYHKGSMLPKGHWGFVVRRFVEAERPSVARRWAAVLRYYTTLKLRDMSTSQAKKALDTIASPMASGSGVYPKPVLKELALQLASNIRGRLGVTRSLRNMDMSSTLRYDDVLQRLNGSSYYYSDQKCSSSMKKKPYGSFVHSWCSNDRYPSGFDQPILAYGLDTQFLDWDLGAQRRGTYSGRVQVIQEAGAKARVVFQPTAKVQFVLQPMHDRLVEIIRKAYPRESDMHDQQRGVYAAMQHLEEGHSCYSVDLSAATDRFPRFVSLEILRELGYSRYAMAIEEISSEFHYCAFAPDKKIRYEVGQPMGLYGSFPLFHLSNLAACEDAVYTAMDQVGEEGVEPFGLDGTFFRVVGDDVIFSDELVANCYKQTMTNLGMKISVSKSFSGQVAEFAGFVIVPTNRGYIAFRPYKIPSVDRMHGKPAPDTVEFLHALGVKVTKIGKHWNAMFEAYRNTLGRRDISLSPLLSDEAPLDAYGNAGGSWFSSLVNEYYSGHEVETEDLPRESNVSTVLQKPEIPLRTFSPEFDYLSMRKDRRKLFEPRHEIQDDPLLREHLSTSFPEVLRELEHMSKRRDHKARGRKAKARQKTKDQPAR